MSGGQRVGRPADQLIAGATAARAILDFLATGDVAGDNWISEPAFRPPPNEP